MLSRSLANPAVLQSHFTHCDLFLFSSSFGRAFTLAKIGAVIGLGYLAGLTQWVPRTAPKGFGPLLGRVCLPVLLFRNVARLNLSSVDFGIIGIVALVKLIIFGLGCVVAKMSQPKGDDVTPGLKWTRMGIFGLFVTTSNDLAVGLAIIQSVYPTSTYPENLSGYLFVIVAVQCLVFTPMGFTMLETGKALDAANKAGLAVDTKGVAKSVLGALSRNPIVMSVIVGFIYNRIWVPTPEQLLLPEQNIPKLMDAILKLLGSAFGMIALFGNGMAVVGKFGLLKGKKLIIPASLTALKVFIMPLMAYYLATAVYSGTSGFCSHKTMAKKPLAWCNNHNGWMKGDTCHWWETSTKDECQFNRECEADPAQTPITSGDAYNCGAGTGQCWLGLCGDGKTPCDPDGRACKDGSKCGVDEKAKLFPDFAFIHGAIPTASGIIVFAARYGAECDLVASSSVLVLVAFAPIMFVTVALLGAEDERVLLKNVGTMGEIMHCLSIAGCFLLMIEFAISPKWRRHPKTAVFDLAVLSFFFSCFHEACAACHNTAEENGGETRGTHHVFYILTNIFRIWRRFYLMLGVGVDLALMHLKGKAVAYKYRHIWRLVSFTCALLFTFVFTGNANFWGPYLYTQDEMDNDPKKMAEGTCWDEHYKPFACWYVDPIAQDTGAVLWFSNELYLLLTIAVCVCGSRFSLRYAYGKKQFLVDIGLYSVCIIGLGTAMFFIFRRPPLGYDPSSDANKGLAARDGLGADGRPTAEQARGLERHHSEHHMLEHCPDRHGRESEWSRPAIDHQHADGADGGKALARSYKTNPYKLGISGGYVFRAKIIVCVGLTGMVVSLATNITWCIIKAGAVATMIMLIGVVTTDGFGMFLFLTFASMRTNRWGVVLMDLRRWWYAFLGQEMHVQSACPDSSTRSLALTFPQSIPPCFFLWQARVQEHALRPRRRQRRGLRRLVFRRGRLRRRGRCDAAVDLQAQEGRREGQPQGARSAHCRARHGLAARPALAPEDVQALRAGQRPRDVASQAFSGHSLLMWI